jgi:hypothetical protein
MVVRGEKANKGLEAFEAATSHQMNRVKGYRSDGAQILVAQRPGKGGMDFTKLMGGKVFAVAADGVSPVFEKDSAGKPTKTQKLEEGLPLYSSSGFYLLSSKEYPALDIIEGYTLLTSDGATAFLVTDKQLAARSSSELTSDLDWDLLAMELEGALGDEFNLVSTYDEAVNKKRMRGIERAKQEAEDNGEDYVGAEFKELAVSPKDGNPFIYYAWNSSSGAWRTGVIPRHMEFRSTTDQTSSRYFGAAEALEVFGHSEEFRELSKQLEEGCTVQFSWVQGHTMRTSISFRRKCENVLAAPDKPQYGDAVYIKAALEDWTKGFLSVMQSQHPTFPAADYDAHHYVVACRQAEVGMDRLGSKWTSPQGLPYDLGAALMA